MYIKRKGSIAGPSFKIPLIGPFLQALDPKFEEYLAQWASGPLSCVSVFHKYVPQVLALTLFDVNIYHQSSYICLQIRCPCLRPRYRTQGVQVPFIRRALYSASC